MSPLTCALTKIVRRSAWNLLHFCAEDSKLWNLYDDPCKSCGEDRSRWMQGTRACRRVQAREFAADWDLDRLKSL